MAASSNKRTMFYFRSLKFVNEEHIKQNKQFFVIHPFSNFRIYWNTFMLFVYIGQFFTIPTDLVRMYKMPGIFNTALDFGITRNCLNLVCCLDIIFNCFTGYCVGTKSLVQKTVLSNWKIFRHYLFTYFVFDVLSNLVIHNTNFIYLKDEASNKRFKTVLYVLSVLKAVRIPTFYAYCRHLYECFELSTARFIMYRLATYSMLYLLLINAIACFSTILIEFVNTSSPLFFRYTIPLDETDQEYEELEYPSNVWLAKKFGCYVYQASLILTNTGMGIRDPFNNLALDIYLMILWFVSKILYWIFVAIALQLFVASTASKRKYVEKVMELEEYMNYKQLPAYLKNRVLTYYEFGFQRTYFHENEILNSLTWHLRQEINMNSCKKLVENVTFFKNIPTTLFVRIVAGLKYDIFMTNDVIAKCGATGDEMYFLASGTVAIYTKSGKEICHLDDGNHFGEIAMVMTNELRVASVVATETCEMYRLDRVDFMRAILPFPDLLEKMQRVAAERMEKTVLMDESNG